MQKKLPKIITLLFLIIFLMQIAGLIFLLMVPEAGQAEFKKAVFDPQTKGLVEKGASIGNYVEAIYKYAIGIVGILATVVMMWGGVIWITAGGNTERIANAKSWINASLTGLILALASYTILYTINPGLVKFKDINPGTVGESMLCCNAKNGLVPPETKVDDKGNSTFTCKPTEKCGKNEVCLKIYTTWSCQNTKEMPTEDVY